jgi:hypothetical protein
MSLSVRLFSFIPISPAWVIRISHTRPIYWSLEEASLLPSTAWLAANRSSDLQLGLGIKPEPEARYPKHPNPYPFSPIPVTQIIRTGNKIEYPN